MNRITSAIAILLCAVILCSCSSNSISDTYFVHSIGFETGKDGVTITALLEKHGKESDDYITASLSSSSIDKAAKELMDEYKDCYFATCDLYFISSSASSETISAIGEEICGSNIFPTTGEILCVKSDSMKIFMDSIKNGDRIKQIKKDTSQNKTNVAAFFSMFSSGKSVSLDTLSLNSGNAVRIGSTTITKNRKAVFHED